MFARYFKQISRLPLHTNQARQLSFINNFLKKKPAPPQPETPSPIKDHINDDINNIKDFQDTLNINHEQTEAPEFATNTNAEADQEFSMEAQTTTRSIQEELDLELDLPYKLYGSQARGDVKTGYMGDRIFTYHKIPKDFVTNHLMKIYTGALYSMAARDEEFLNEYLEKHMCQRLFQSLSNLTQKGYTIKVVKDVSGVKGDPISPKINITDMVLVKGLNVDRDQNREEAAYHKYVDIEDMGLVIYTPLEIQDPKNFIDPKQNQKMYDDHAKVLMRLLVEIESPLKVVITRPNGDEILLDNTLKNFKHTAVFETQMKAPPKFTNANKLENYMEWLGKFKFGVWKMADLDNWMLGNPLILQQNTRDKFTDEIFKGSSYDLGTKIDLKKV